MAAMLVAGCAAHRVDAGVFHSPKGYRVTMPNPGWMIVSEDHEDEGGGRVDEGLGRPVDELGDGVDEARLDFVLEIRGRGVLGPRRSEEGGAQDETGGGSAGRADGSGTATCRLRPHGLSRETDADRQRQRAPPP